MLNTLSLLILLSFTSTYGSDNLSRLDPHGQHKVNLKDMPFNKHTECLICHEKNKKISRNTLIKKGNESCSSCHPKFPHSGITEHMGKNLETLKIGLKGKINCLSCHRPHRKKLATDTSNEQWNAKESSFVFTPDLNDNEKENFVGRRGNTPLLKVSCIDCHKLEKLF